MTGRDEQEPRRSEGPRHAAPRASGHRRARLLAFTAVPTALLMGGSVVPDLASAATTTNSACASGSTAANATGSITQVPKSQLTPVPDPSATKASASGGGQAISAAFVSPNAGPGAQQQAAAAVTSRVVQADDGSGGGNLIGDIINGITGIFTPSHPSKPSPSATATPAVPAAPRIGAPVTPNTSSPAPASPSGQAAAQPPASPAAPAPASSGPAAVPTPSAGTSGAPSASGGASPSSAPSTAPSASPSGSATGSPAPGASSAPSGSPAPTGTAAPSAVASALANGDTRPLCPVDTSNLSAAAAQGGQVVPDQNWTLKSTKLALHGAVFGGVYEVHTPTTTKRVLKFTVSSVDIGDLDMSTIENTAAGGKPPQTFHVQGAPGSTSTMTQGPITMYVESLSGELSALYGIPLPPLGTITLTPDTLPTWLYDLIGAVPIPLDITMTGVTAIQAGQFGGTLHIPGMHLYNDTTPYQYGH
ncbi:hypothetical protein OG500_24680 [Kitasatospora sp. NBC_01250]|uniref:hypothetical protein n=1 Tax=Kitasatospora sp. NBC_01250 TaxID=2903571 RepID=UPI002E32DED7|nr:hypothetical protein [Kitasatospora sp. NBC_01250]